MVQSVQLNTIYSVCCTEYGLRYSVIVLSIIWCQFIWNPQHKWVFKNETICPWVVIEIFGFYIFWKPNCRSFKMQYWFTL